MSRVDGSIGDRLASSLNTFFGEPVSYYRNGTLAGTLTAAISKREGSYVDANGAVIDMNSVDIKCKTDDLPVDEPQRGDRIVCSGVTYEVLPVGGEKSFLQTSPSMTRIHAKQVL